MDLNYLLQLEQQQRKQGVAVNVITRSRAQAKKQEEEARRDEELDAQDNALPKLLEPSVASEVDAEQAVASDIMVDVVQSVASDAESDAEQSVVVDADDLDHAGSDSKGMQLS